MSAGLVGLAGATQSAVKHACQLMVLLNRELRAHGQYAIADDVTEMLQDALETCKKSLMVRETVEKRFNA